MSHNVEFKTSSRAHVLTIYSVSSWNRRKSENTMKPSLDLGEKLLSEKSVGAVK